MAIRHATSGEVIDISPLGTGIGDAQTTTLLIGESLQFIRIVMAAGKTIAPHQVAGEVAIQCIEGSVDVREGRHKHELTAGSLIHLKGGKQHSLSAKDDSSLLVTIVRPPVVGN
jgi:quercetin dioxygenase-like cupin family protein